VLVSAPELSGDRVTLRPYAAGFTEAELAALYRWGCDDELLSLAGGSALDMTFERFRDVFLRQLPGRNGERQQLFAILDETGEMIGRIGLFGFDDGAGSAELGIVIGERARWGHGYGPEAVDTLARFGFDALGLRKIVLYTYAENERAQHAFKSCGFTPVRRLRRFSFEKGIHWEIEMALRPEDLARQTV
jgi:RimJ/RimL family protein N-acetyltransferase